MDCDSKKEADNKTLIKDALQMAWPSVIESFFIAFVGMVDSMMVSRLGSYAVAAVGLTVQPKFIGLSIFIALNMAVSVLVARRKGENKRESANGILMTAVLLVIGASVVVSIVCVVFADPIMGMVGSEPDTHEGAVLYFRIIMGCMIFNVISLIINAAQRGSGNTRISMWTNLTSNLVNVIINYLLINGNLGFPAWGIKGAAVATVLGSVIACGMSIRSLFDKNSFVQVSLWVEERIRPSFDYTKQIFKIAYNVLIEQLLLRFGFMSVTMMTAKLGTAAFAVHQVGMNVMSLSFSFGDGMQAAAVSLIGQSLGRSEPELAQKYGAICQRMGNIISIALSVLYLLGGKWFFGLYFREEELVAMGVRIMRLMVLIVLLQIAQVIYMGCLRGAGDVRFTTIASTMGVTIVRPLSSYLFAYVLGTGLIGIWLGVICDQIVRFSLTAWRFKSGKWTKVKV